MRAYYFATKDRKLSYGDGRKIVVGETHSVDIREKLLRLCIWGLHASVKPLDALKYAPGSILYIVELSGQIVEGDDKVCAQRRTYLAELDAEELLREFAKRQALINIEKIKPYCSKSDYNTIITYLQTGKGRSAAEAAARSAEAAAEAAAWSVARSAARSAAWSAARSAAWSAARSAAEAAARSAARSAAWSAAAANERALLVARSAAWSSANEMLSDMINSALKDNK
jgi:hypothetical protein